MTDLSTLLGIQYPVLCGPMYPCSNPELVAAASRGGGLGIVQPLSMTYVHKHDYRAGLQLIKKLAPGKPFGMNALIEGSSKIYLDRMRKWVDISLEEGCRLIVTSLGNPKWVVEKAHAAGALVFHDVINRKWALKALEGGVDGLICVNSRAGGHAGPKTPQELFEELRSLGKPLICAGGIGTPEQAAEMIRLGYVGVQLGTRFIASTECTAHDDYKAAIVKANAEDIVLTERLTGVPVAVINTPSVKKMGTQAGPILRWMLQNPKLKHYARAYFSLLSFRSLKKASLQGLGYQDFWQAGKSVDGIDKIESAEILMQRFGKACIQKST